MDEEWQNNYQALVNFKAQHGHINLPPPTQHDGKQEEHDKQGEMNEEEYAVLRKWVSQQRYLYHRYRTGEDTSSISQEQFAFLNAIMDEEGGVLMDMADAYTIRAVLYSPERKRAHNELMHQALMALFPRNSLSTGENSITVDNELDGNDSSNDIEHQNHESTNQGSC
jgi:hypothetical protein